MALLPFDNFVRDHGGACDRKNTDTNQTSRSPGLFPTSWSASKYPGSLGMLRNLIGDYKSKIAARAAHVRCSLVDSPSTSIHVLRNVFLVAILEPIKWILQAKFPHTQADWLYWQPDLV
jgi:hypothetical protein